MSRIEDEIKLIKKKYKEGLKRGKKQAYKEIEDKLNKWWQKWNYLLIDQRARDDFSKLKEASK